MGFIKEFKEFAMKGNVVDLAVGVIIGGAFGKIVSSMVNDIIMPPVSLILGDKGFTELFYALDGKKYESMAAATAAGAPVFAYGNFIQTVIDFAILAFIIFLMIKGINKMKKKEAEAPAAAPEPTESEKLLAEIRDLLRK
jgi:large conductance mechanosensitive channel